MPEIGGKKVNGWWLVGGAAGVGIVFYIYKRSSNSSSSTVASSTSGIDPLTGLPASEDNTIDPATGLTYLQEAQQYGSVSAAEAAVAGNYSAYGGSSYGYSGLATGYPTYGGTTTTGGTPGAYANNSQWAQAATAGLVALGYNSQDVSAALGLYFQSMPLGTATDGVSYLQIIQAAVAEFGPPPVGTFSIIAPPSTPGGVGGTGSPGQVTLPNVVGERAAEAGNQLKTLGLVPVVTPGTPKGSTGTISAMSPVAGTVVAIGSTVTLTNTITGGSGSGSGSGSGGSTAGLPPGAAQTLAQAEQMARNGIDPYTGQTAPTTGTTWIDSAGIRFTSNHFSGSGGSTGGLSSTDWVQQDNGTPVVPATSVIPNAGWQYADGSAGWLAAEKAWKVTNPNFSITIPGSVKT